MQRGVYFAVNHQSSLLFDDCVLMTGEVDRTTDVEHGTPIREALTAGA